MHVPVELKIKYLQRRTQDIEKLRALMEKNEFSEASKLGHQVKGNAITFEFPQMAGLGIEIEKAAKLEDRFHLSRLLDEMESMIRSAQIDL
jgi:HPt (histidine-containing phosphotransfer) domain-containing protein